MALALRGMERRLVILGSGELAPPMVKTYRHLFDGLDARRGVYLDTPFGFQENVPQLSEKIEQYFATSLQWEFRRASWTDDNQESPRARAAFLNALHDASVIFAGPGSPTYALRLFRDVGLGDTLRERLSAGTLVCFSSAAALTLGRHTAPIYEIYKVGESPTWREGLDVLSLFGLSCSIIPHFDNAEGGNHDTRFCYLGATRLAKLEAQLPSGEAILGIDEHTAVTLSLDSDTIHVEGKGFAYWRSGGEQRRLERDVAIPLNELRTTPSVAEHRRPPNASPEAVDDFELILSGGPSAAAALERVMRQAEQGGAGRIDPQSLVEALLHIRRDARQQGLYGISDQIRDALSTSGIEVSDTPEGATWRLNEEDSLR